MLDAEAHLVGEGSVATTREAIPDFFAALPTARVILKVGTHSPWVSRVIASCGHEVLVANPRRVRLISAAVRKNDRIDAVTLARLGRADSARLSPIRLAATPCMPRTLVLYTEPYGSVYNDPT